MKGTVPTLLALVALGLAVGCGSSPGKRATATTGASH